MAGLLLELLVAGVVWVHPQSTRWAWRQLETTPGVPGEQRWWFVAVSGIWAGGGSHDGVLRPHLESEREMAAAVTLLVSGRAAVVAHGGSCILCRLCPALCKCAYGENGGSCPSPCTSPDTGTWSQGWPAVLRVHPLQSQQMPTTPWLFLHSQPQSSPGSHF